MTLMRPIVTFLLVLFVLLIQVVHSQSAGFPTLDDPKELRAALEAIHKEDELQREPGLSVDRVLADIGQKIVKNEVRLRSGYKTFNEPCSPDPELNGLLLKPPKPFPIEPYIIWQDRILNSSESFCNPFKHLQCSSLNTLSKCECRQGLVWNEGQFELPHRRITPALRIRENICVIPIEQPCRIPDNSPSIYYNIFRYGVSTINGGLANDPPHCGGLGECSNSSFTQRYQVCAPRGWDSDIFHLEDHLNNLTRGILGDTCNFEEHNRLFAFSKEDKENAPGFLTRRKMILKELNKPGTMRFCSLDYFLTCGNSGKCECLFPSVPNTKPSPNETEYCALKEKKYNQCEKSPELMAILGNKTLTYKAKSYLMIALSYILKGCPPNMICVFEGVMDNPMEVYCTCEAQLTGMNCRENLTRFLWFVRAPSFPSDVKDIVEKRNIFSELNKKAIEFEKVFKLQEFTPCNLTAEMMAQSTIDTLKRLDQLGTVMTKADYDSLSDSIVKLTNDLQTQGLCNRFANNPLECNSTSNTCTVINLDVLLEACRRIYPFVCNSNEFFITSGGCGCAPINPNRQLGINEPNNVSPALKAHHHYIDIVIAYSLDVLIRRI